MEAEKCTFFGPHPQGVDLSPLAEYLSPLAEYLFPLAENEPPLAENVTSPLAARKYREMIVKIRIRAHYILCMHIIICTRTCMHAQRDSK